MGPVDIILCQRVKYVNYSSVLNVDLIEITKQNGQNAKIGINVYKGIVNAIRFSPFFECTQTNATSSKHANSYQLNSLEFLLSTSLTKVYAKYFFLF